MKAHFQAKIINTSEKEFTDSQTGLTTTYRKVMIVFPDSREGVLALNLDDSIAKIPDTFMLKDCNFEADIKINFIKRGEFFQPSGLKFVITKITLT